jgi:hypothetical protein
MILNLNQVVSKTFTTTESYKSYKGNLTKEEYLLINDTFNDVLFKELLTTGNAISLPHRLGKLQIVKFRPKKRRAINFHETKLHGKTIYHDNIETDGYAGRLHWHKLKYPFINKSLWRFRFTRNRVRYDDFSLVKYLKHNGVYHLQEL